MALDKEHLQYPHRSYGMDHDYYDWSMLSTRKPVNWPKGKKLALWVNVCMQFFPLNQRSEPFPVPGGMSMPYPDLRHFTLRDYGNRVGIFRCLKALDRFNIKATFAFNGYLAKRNHYLLNTIIERGDEIICHGWHMDALHHSGQNLEEERELINRSIETLRQLSGQEITGWLSPARNESRNTPALLVENGIRYFSDWVNDDMPYRFNTAKGPLWAMPLSNELEDRFILLNNLHSECSYVEQVCDACNFLLQESKQQGGRILALNIHPWVLGQPHRIGKLEQVLSYLSDQSNIWNASSGEILDSFIAQQ
ncbi:MAG: polysaccharide deacetylase family protein [Cellvibrionales bacterium]|nr:polysaccharide deacetylase family protein [Cellvibrionales bacterium]